MKVYAIFIGVLLCLCFALMFIGQWNNGRWATPEKDYWSDLQDKDMVHVRAEMVTISGQSYFKVAIKDWNAKVLISKEAEEIKKLQEKCNLLQEENKKLKENSRLIVEAIIGSFRSEFSTPQTNEVCNAMWTTNAFLSITNELYYYNDLNYHNHLTNGLPDRQLELLQEKYNKLEKEYNELKALQPIFQNPPITILPCQWTSTNIGWLTNCYVNDLPLTKTNQEQKNLELFKMIDDYNKKHPVSLIETAKGSK